MCDQHTCSLIRAFARRNVELLTEHLLEALSLTGGCTCSSESTLVKMPHCWKSHDTAHVYLRIFSRSVSLLFDMIVFVEADIDRNFEVKSTSLRV